MFDEDSNIPAIIHTVSEGVLSVLAGLLAEQSPSKRLTMMFCDSAFGSPYVERLKTMGYAEGPVTKRLMTMPSIGPITATAFPHRRFPSEDAGTSGPTGGGGRVRNGQQMGSTILFDKLTRQSLRER